MKNTKHTAQGMNGTTRGLLLLCICLTAVLVAPSTASAGFPYFVGKMEGGGKIAFDTKSRKGKIKQVLTDTFKRVPVSCDEGNELLDLQIVVEPGPGIPGTQVVADPLRVKHRSFRLTPQDQPGGLTITFRGRFNKKGKKATGTYRAQGDFSLDGVIAHNCDTGTVEWSALETTPTN